MTIQQALHIMRNPQSYGLYMVRKAMIVLSGSAILQG